MVVVTLLGREGDANQFRSWLKALPTKRHWDGRWGAGRNSAAHPPHPDGVTAGPSLGGTKARSSEGRNSADAGKGVMGGDKSTTSPVVAGDRFTANPHLAGERSGADRGFRHINANEISVTPGDVVKSPPSGNVTYPSNEEARRCAARAEVMPSSAPSMVEEALRGVLKGNQQVLEKGIFDKTLNGLSCTPLSPTDRDMIMQGCEDGPAVARSFPLDLGFGLTQMPFIFKSTTDSLPSVQPCLPSIRPSNGYQMMGTFRLVDEEDPVDEGDTASEISVALGQTKFHRESPAPIPDASTKVRSQTSNLKTLEASGTGQRKN